MLIYQRVTNDIHIPISVSPLGSQTITTVPAAAAALAAAERRRCAAEATAWRRARSESCGTWGSMG